MGAISRAARVCALVVVLTGTVLVASAQADVYWANAGTHTIGRANLDGTNPNPRWLGVYALDIAVSGGYLYYINVPGDSIGRVALDGGSSDPNLITGLNNPNTQIMSDRAPSVIARTRGRDAAWVTVLEPYGDAPRVTTVDGKPGGEITVTLSDGTRIHASLDGLIKQHKVD